MAVMILRKTGFWGAWGKMVLLVHDEEAITIANHQSVTMDLPTYPAYLMVKGDPKASILVSDHQQYILCLHPLFQGALLLASALLTLSLLIDALLIQYLIYATLFALWLVFHFCLPRYCFKPLIGPAIQIKKYC